MTMQEALMKIYNCVNELYNQGFVPWGEIQLVKPKMPGLTEPNVTLHINDPIGTIKIETIKMGSKEHLTSSQLLGEAVDKMIGFSGKIDGPTIEIPINQQFTGGICVKCGQAVMIRMGTCEYCTNCGESGGCS